MIRFVAKLNGKRFVEVHRLKMSIKIEGRYQIFDKYQNQSELKVLVDAFNACPLFTSIKGSAVVDITLVKTCQAFPRVKSWFSRVEIGVQQDFVNLSRFW